MDTASIVAAMSASDYHSDPAIGSSGLKKLMISPAHYWANYLDPERERRDPIHFRVGRAWHCALFEPQAFAERFAIGHDAHPLTKRAVLLGRVLAGEVDADDLVALPDGLSATSKEGKGLIAEIEGRGQVACAAEDLAFVTTWLPRLKGRDVLPEDRVNKVLRAAAIARQLPISRVVFDQLAQFGAAEESLFHVDPISGVRIKIRPDYAVRPCKTFQHGLIIDGKSTTDASNEGFGRQVWNLDYGLQAALYTRVFQQVHRTAERPPFLWLAQEKDSPFAARYYAAGKDLIEHWDKRIDGLLPVFAACQRAGEWPAYPETVETLAMPTWAQKQIDEDAA